MSKLQLLIRSRKFWAAVIALVLVFVKAYFPQFPFTQDELLGAVIALAAYIFGIAIEDGLVAFRK